MAAQKRPHADNKKNGGNNMNHNEKMETDREDISVGFLITKKGLVNLKLDLRSRWTYVILSVIAVLAGSPTVMPMLIKVLRGG